MKWHGKWKKPPAHGSVRTVEKLYLLPAWIWGWNGWSIAWGLTTVKQVYCGGSSEMLPPKMHLSRHKWNTVEFLSQGKIK